MRCFDPSLSISLHAERLPLSSSFSFKIDVEGGELAVLMAARNTINRHQSIIQCEVLHAHRDSERVHNDQHMQAIRNLLNELNYVPFLCVLPREAPQSLLGFERIHSFPIAVYADQPQTCDYLLVPRLRESQIADL